jgi:hypothetical protein
MQAVAPLDHADPAYCVLVLSRCDGRYWLEIRCVVRFT